VTHRGPFQPRTFCDSVIPRSRLFPRLSSPSTPSLSSQQRGSSPRIVAGASSGPTPPAPALSCAEGSRAGRRTPGGVSAERGRGAESPPSPCAHAAGDAAQGTIGFLGCKHTPTGHVGLLVNQHPEVLLLRAALRLSPACSIPAMPCPALSSSSSVPIPCRLPSQIPVPISALSHPQGLPTAHHHPSLRLQARGEGYLGDPGGPSPARNL